MSLDRLGGMQKWARDEKAKNIRGLGRVREVKNAAESLNSEVKKNRYMIYKKNSLK